MSRFPAAFRLPAFRFSVIRFPPRDWAFLTVGLPQPKSGPRRGYRVPHARATTGVGAPYTPRTAVLLPAKTTAQPAPAASQRPVLAPSYGIPSAGLCFTRHQRGFTQFTRPVIPLACGRPDGTGRPWAFPRASNPADQEPDDARRGGDRPSSTDLDTYAYGISRTSNLACSLVACDLASQVVEQTFGSVARLAACQAEDGPRPGGRVKRESGSSA